MEKNYRKARKEAGIKLEQAAVHLGISVSTLLSWERGSTQPTATKLADMAQLYGVTTDYLLSIAG